MNLDRRPNDFPDSYSTTSAGETTAGGVAGYEQENKIQQGQTGTSITQETEQRRNWGRF
jgi:hypothetical protein